MRIVTTFDELSAELGSRHTCLTIGVFDGVHLGHQSLVKQTVETALAEDLASVVVTFKRHPLSVLAPPYTPRRLITNARKSQLLADLGADYLVMLDFTAELAAVEPDVFVLESLLAKARLRYLICGYDFTFGCRGSGNIDLLESLGRENGFQLAQLPAISRETRAIKSTHIRDLVYAGHVAEAQSFLTRPHEVPGVIGSGASRGRTIGFPTANLTAAPHYQVPAHGVYLCAARVGLEEKRLPAMVNIGVSPTFGNNRPTIEAHIIDFDGDIHGEALSLFFLERLRDERKFPSVDALVQQLNSDRSQASELWDTSTIRQTVTTIPDAVLHELSLTD